MVACELHLRDLKLTIGAQSFAARGDRIGAACSEFAARDGEQLGRRHIADASSAVAIRCGVGHRRQPMMRTISP